MTTPPTHGERPSEDDARWADPSMPVSMDVRTEQPVAEAPFDPYRFGAPEHPVPPEYAPPGYVPPAPTATAPPVSVAPNPYAYQAPYGQAPHGQPPYPQQQYPYGAPPLHQYPQPRTGNGKAIAALVLGILSIFFFWASFLDLALIIPAIVFGSLGLSEAKRPGGNGRGLAVSGLVLAVVGALAAVLFTVAVLPKAARCVNDYPSGSAEYDNCIRDIFQ